MDTDTFLRALSACVDKAALVEGPAAEAPYLTDWLHKWSGRALAIVRPQSVQTLADVVRLCAEAGVPIVPQGGNTSMSGGATPDASGREIILSTQRLRQVREVDPINHTMTLEAGVILADAQRIAQEAGHYFPLSLGAEGSCTIGGNLATNAGGTAVLRYGNMRELALGLEVVLPDGRIWHGLRGLRKDNTGFDLRDLFIGSEGTLGIITAAVLKLYALPTHRATAWVGAPSVDALTRLLGKLREQCGERLSAFEMMTSASLGLVLDQIAETRPPLAERHAFNALVEISDTGHDELMPLLEHILGAALEDGLIEDAMLAVSAAQAQSLWKIREGISLAQVQAGKVIKHDVALPISQLAGFVAEADAAIARTHPELQIINFGHIGDGNLHYNVLVTSPFPSDDEAFHHLAEALNRLVHDIVVSRHGSISAEHGVGQLRKEELAHYKSDVDMDLMHQIKHMLDPKGIMNPGKLL